MRRVCVILLLATACSGESARQAPSAKDLAQAGVLRLQDLPDGYARKDVPLPPANAGCLATSVAAEADGAEYVQGQVAITSTASVATSRAEALARLAALAKAQTCLHDALAARLAPSKLDVTGFTATPAPLDIPDAYAFSTDASAVAPGGFALTIQGYSLGAVVGSTQITLSVTKSADTGLTLPDAEALLEKAVRRASSVD